MRWKPLFAYHNSLPKISKIAMNPDFSFITDRRRSGSIKWCRYEEDVIPMWLADMDFMCPESIKTAIAKRLEHNIFGYEEEPEELREIVVDKLQQRYGWKVSPDSLVFLTGVVNSINLLYRSILSPGEGVMVHTPAYPPFLSEPEKAGLELQDMALKLSPDGVYEIDFDTFETSIKDNSGMYILCNPHNPTGHVYNRKELQRIGEICLKNNLIICSDDIHCDIVYPGSDYTPIASLSDEISTRTITLISPGKTYNLAGMAFSIAVIPDEAMRQKLTAIRTDLDLRVSKLAFTAATAAYSDSDTWLKELLIYLEKNRDLLADFVKRELPGINMGTPGGTFLAWLDCRQRDFHKNPQEFFLNQARLAFNDGAPFGKYAEGFIRLNFGCPQSILREALERMKIALK